MVLLSQTNSPARRLKSEGSFIAAAVQMNLPLCNRMLVKPCRGENLRIKKNILTEAVGIFRELTKTEWKHPGVRPCTLELPEAA